LNEEAAKMAAVPFVPFCPKLPWGADLHCESVEHREKYSMGKGFYLQARRCNPWRVRKVNVGKNGGYFATLARRCAHLERKQEASAAVPEVSSVEGVTVTENEEKGGVEIRFPSKPAADVLAMLKAAGWRWSRFGACWYAKANDESRAMAARIAGL
jgi:hypothetical protein